MARKIQRETRLNIFDSIRIEKVDWRGQMNDVDFLSRLFDLESLPSEDRRFDSMYSDVWQHRINNDDWDTNWVFDDKRLDLLNADDEVFLKFLCEMLHPVVRPDAVEAERLRQYFNDLLKADNFELIERARIASRPVFAARALPPIPNLPISHAHSTLVRADASYVSQQITRMESSVESDPGLAVGTAKELVETVCKTILEDRSVAVDRNWDLSQLVKSTTKELELTPDDIDNAAKAYDSIKL